MSGAGVISARGGKGSGSGGGGSGGRIAIHHSTQDFRGTTVADGGIAGQLLYLLVSFCFVFLLLLENLAQIPKVRGSWCRATHGHT